jgi:hypothetical protein
MLWRQFKIAAVSSHSGEFLAIKPVFPINHLISKNSNCSYLMFLHRGLSRKIEETVE